MFKDKEHPDHSHHVEHEVGKGSPLCRQVGRDGCQVSGDGGADVLSQDHGCRTGEVNPTLCSHDQCQSYRCAGGLYDDRQHGAHHQKEEGGEDSHVGEVLYERKYFRVILQVRHRFFQKVESHKQKGKSKNEFAQRLVPAPGGEDQRQCYTHQWNGQCTDGELAETEEGDHPCCNRGANVGAHNHADGLDQAQQSCIDKTYHHDGGGRRGLYQGGDQQTGEDTHHPVLCHGRQDVPEFVACQFLQAFAHDLHTIKEKPQ